MGDGKSPPDAAAAPRGATTALGTQQASKVDDTGDDGRLRVLADDVHDHLRRGRSAVAEALEAQFAIGRALAEAREILPSNQEFGAWFRAQKFGFSVQWAGILRRAAQHEVAVRSACESQLSDGASPNIEKALTEVTRPREWTPPTLTEDKHEDTDVTSTASETPGPPAGRAPLRPRRKRLPKRELMERLSINLTMPLPYVIESVLTEESELEASHLEMQQWIKATDEALVALRKLKRFLQRAEGDR